MTTSIGNRLRERHGLTLLGVAAHAAVLMVLLAAGIALLGIRPVTLAIAAEREMVLSEPEARALSTGLRLVECAAPDAVDGLVPVDSGVRYRVGFEWYRDADTPFGRTLLGAPEAAASLPTHLTMTVEALCPGQAPVVSRIGPVLLPR